MTFRISKQVIAGGHREQPGRAVPGRRDGAVARRRRRRAPHARRAADHPRRRRGRQRREQVVRQDYTGDHAVPRV